MDIKPILNLNRHPRDCEDFSLIGAENIKLTLDQSALVTEESIKKNDTIKNSINEYYKDKAVAINGISNWKIIGCIPCSEELVLFVYNKLVTPSNDIMRAIIIRYNIEQNIAIVTYDKDGGIIIDSPNTTITGTFTYNVENSLIIAIAEHNRDDKFIPLRTINLGIFNQINNNNVYNDLDIKDELLSCSPQIYIPNTKNLTYVKGSTYKGWYYFFIRIKINKIDYTQWFPFGESVFVDNIDEVNIIKHGFNQNINADKLSEKGHLVQRIFPNYKPTGYVTGCSDCISNSSDITTNTIKFDIVFDDKMEIIYNENFVYQVAFIVSSKKYTKSYKSFDINNNNKTFVINPKEFAEVSSMELISDNYNYFNVKNITNYKNQLYIASYKENNINTNFEKVVNNISSFVDYEFGEAVEDFQNNIGLIKIGNTKTDIDGNIDMRELFSNDKQTYQFNAEQGSNKIKLSSFFNIEDNVLISINGIEVQSSKVFISKRPFDNIYSEHVGPIKLSGSIDINSGIINATINNNSIKIDLDKYYMITPMPYINTKNSFEYRCKKCTLIPGEVYNFFIHFIDKYGQFTNGYKINNDCKITTVPNNTECYPVEFEFRDIKYYVSFPIRQKVLNKDSNKVYSINTNNLMIYKNFNNGVLTNPIVGGLFRLIKDAFINRFSIFCNESYENYEWWQLVNIPISNKFNYYYNNNNEKLFRVPNSHDTIKNYIHYYPTFKNITLPNDNYIGYFISYEKVESIRQITGILTNNDFRTNHYTFRQSNPGWSNDYNEMFSDSVFPPLNFKATNKMRFYSGLLDIADKLEFDYSIMEIKPAVFPPDKYFMYWQQFSFFSYPKDLNKPNNQINYIAANSTNVYPIPKYKLAIADSAQDNRMGVGTCIEMNNSYGLFGEIDMVGTTNEKSLPLYIATLINPTKDLYMNKEKVLIRCGDYIYDGKTQVTINKGLNGRITYDGVLVYDGHGVSFNEASSILTGLSNNMWYYPVCARSIENNNTVDNYVIEPSGTGSWNNSWDAYTPFVNYLQFALYSDTMYESKSFKNNPKGIIYPIYVGNKDAKYQEKYNAFAPGCMVTPINSIDLFENRQSSGDQFNPKTYTNYKDDIVSIEVFNKTVRRSNVIQDESRINGWRTFSLESYKNITENKGKITNLYGVGTMFLVHTEHSLFMFDMDNTMKTENKSIQLYQPDIFEVDYKEILTSNLGYGGLQDSTSWIADQFGYIYYNKDLNRFFIFDNGQLGNPDEEIIEFLNKYKPHKCIFANDKSNHRLLIKMTYNKESKEHILILSFNYDTKKFISTHKYDFDVAYNTKIDLFLQFDDGLTSNLFEFVKDSSSYSIFENRYLGSSLSKYTPVWTRESEVKTENGSIQVYTDGNINPYFIPAKLSIVVNSEYNLIKLIEYITYKLYKINTNKQNDHISSPVEGRIVPFSGISLKIYNDQIDTGTIDIFIDNEIAKNVFGNYDKPYWDLGNWNFSYLRNIKDSTIDDLASRLYGNWFVFEFTINNDESKVEFESLKVNLTKDKML